MDFLTRFKGRTNFLTKLGPNDLMSEASTPVLKVHSQPEPSSTYSGAKKMRPMKQKLLYHTEAQFSPKRHHTEMTDGNSMSPVKGGMFMRNHSHHRKPSSQSDLHIVTDPQLNEQERRQHWAPPRHDYFTPQHGYMARHEPEEVEEWNFSQRVNNMKAPRLVHYNSARINQNNEMMVDSPGLKQSYGNSNLIQRPSLINTNPKSNLLRPGFKFNGDLSPTPQQQPQGHENRVNKMVFVERQEKVLNKYRPNLQVQTDSYSQKYLNRSVDSRYAAQGRRY